MGVKLKNKLAVAFIATILFICPLFNVKANNLNVWQLIDNGLYSVADQTWQTDADGNTPDLYSITLNGNTYTDGLTTRTFYPSNSYNEFIVNLKYFSTSQLGNKVNSNISSYTRIKENGMLCFELQFANKSALSAVTAVYIDYSIGNYSNYTGNWIKADYLSFGSATYVMIFHQMTPNEYEQNNIRYRFKFEYKNVREDIDYFSFYSLHCWPCTPSIDSYHQNIIALNKIANQLQEIEINGGSNVDLSTIESLLASINSNVEHNATVLNDIQIKVNSIYSALYDTDNVSWLKKIYNAIVGDKDNPTDAEKKLDDATSKLTELDNSINTDAFDGMDFNKLSFPEINGNKFQFLKQRIELTYSTLINSNSMYALALLLPLALFVVFFILKR